MAGPLRKPRARGPQQGQEPFSIHVSLPTVLLFAAVVAVAAGWSFFMGFMVGRGQNPEVRLEEITGFDLEPANEAVASAAQTLPQRSEPAESEAAASTNPQTGAEPTADQVPSAKQPPQVPPQATQQPASSTVARPYPFARPSGSGLAAWGEQPVVNDKRSANAPAQGVGKAAPPVPTTPRFDFLYQVAAFKRISEAEKLCASLAARGIKAVNRKSGKVLLVLVSLRGTEAEAAAMRETLQGIGLGRPVILSRKAVTPQAASRKRNR
ncbi:MAG: SPOR domain-containing protein [Desulfovibrio sp.]|nr:SPOR domain-containing protein [Desulfovibrio sp.]